MVEIHEKNNNPQAKKRAPSYKNQIGCSQTGKYRKGWLLSGVLLASVLLFYVQTMRQPKEYKAISKIAVQEDNLFSESAAAVVMEMLQSRRVLYQAWRKSNRSSQTCQSCQLLEAVPEETLRRNIHVEQSKETGVISISYTGKDGNQAAAIVNNLSEIVSASLNRAASPHLQAYQEMIKKRLQEIEEDRQILEEEKDSLLLYQNKSASQGFSLLLSQKIRDLKAKIITIGFETDLLKQNGLISVERALEKRQLKSILQNTLTILENCQTESVPASRTAAAVSRQYREIEINLEIIHAVQSALEQESGALHGEETKEAPIVQILEKAEYPQKAALFARDKMDRIKGKSICLLNHLFLHMEE